MLNMEVKIGTHNGPFHADDVMACAMLKKHPNYKNAKIERTREESILDQCDIVVDVGRRFSHQARRYDHHQEDFDLTMEKISRGKIKSKTKLSSAGLIFFYYGEEIIREEIIKEEDRSKAKIVWIWKRMYFNLINEIDLIDNKGSVPAIIRTGFTRRVGRLNPAWDDAEPDYDQSFVKAVDLASEEFRETLEEIHSQFRAMLAVKEKISDREKDHKSGQVLIFDRYTSWSSIIGEVEMEAGIKGTIMFVINPYTDSGDFSVSTVNNRILLPFKWRGLEGEKLQKATGLAGAKFVHNGGHFARIDNKEDAVRMVDMVLDMGGVRPIREGEKDELGTGERDKLTWRRTKHS